MCCIQIFPLPLVFPCRPTAADRNFWAQPPQYKLSSPLGKGLAVYRVYEGVMSYFRVLIRGNV